MGGPAPIERGDERLNDGHRAVVAACVAPRFQEVRFRNVPVAQLRRLIVIQTEMYAKRRLAHRVSEAQVYGGRVDGIAAQYDDHVHHAGVHVRDEIAKRLKLIDGFGFDWVCVNDRSPDVAERGIHGVCEGVHDRRLGLAGDHHTRAAMSTKIRVMEPPAR